MPTAAPPTRRTQLPSEIRSRLSSTGASLRGVDFGLALARALLVLAISVVGVFLLDVVLEPPLAVVRLFALFVAMLASGITLYLLTSPFRRALDDDTVALLLEGEFPELEGGLISSVQLLRDADPYTSGALVDQTVDRAAKTIQGLDTGRVVRLGMLLPLWALFLAFAGACGGLLTNEDVRAYAAIFKQRVVQGQEVGYPKLVAFEVDMEKVTRVAKGEDFDLKVKVTKGATLLDELVVVTQFADGRIETRELRPTGDAFAKLYQNVTQPFKFRVVAPGHGVRSEVHEVVVVQRPRVERYEFVLRYPAYVGRAPEALSLTNLKVPSGTVVSYMAVVNKPLQRATLLEEREVRENGQRRYETTPGPEPIYLEAVSAADLAPQGPPPEGGEGGAWSELAETATRLGIDAAKDGRRVLLGRFAARTAKDFRFDLLSEEGQRTGNQPVRFSIQVVPDKRPTVSIPVPGGLRQVTPQAKVDLKVVAQDDYGLKHVELRLRVVRGASEEPWKSIPLELPEGSDREAKLPYVLSLADYRVASGDRVEYMAVGFDYNTEPNRAPGSSRRYVLQIGAPEDLERMFQDRLAALKERLVSAGRDQQEARKASQAFTRELAPKSVLSEDDKRRVKRLEYEQRRVTTRLRDVEKALEELVQERTANRLTEESAMRVLDDLKKGVSELAQEKSPQIERRFADARKSQQLDDKTKAALRQVPDLQQNLADDLRRLATRIDKYGDFTEVIQELRDLLKGEDQVIEGAEKAAAAENR